MMHTAWLFLLETHKALGQAWEKGLVWWKGGELPSAISEEAEVREGRKEKCIPF